MISIRKRLLTSILSIIIIITALLAIATYFSIREEMDELYDENMKQVALSLANIDIEKSGNSLNNSSNSKLKGEEEFLIQIWKQKKLTYTSHPAIEFQLQQIGRKNFGRTTFQGNRWRYYQATSGTDTVQVSQDLSKRHDVIVEIYRVLVVPILIQIPVLIAVIWLLVGYGFKPLTLVSENIRKRTASFLEPISETTAPSEIQTMVGALNDLLIRLKSALNTQRRFTSDAAHELRTPLTAVKLQLDLLKRATSTDEKEEALVSLERGVNRSIRLVEQLLELARQEPENTMHPLEKVSLNDILNESAIHAEPLSKSKLINLSFSADKDLKVLGNAPQLLTMFDNLLNNAVLYTPENGNIRVTAKKNDNIIIAEISDNGRGIPDEHKHRVFDRFYRIAGTNVIGSGLGLSIVQNIATFHHARLSIHAGLDGKGTTFRIEIPAIS